MPANKTKNRTGFPIRLSCNSKEELFELDFRASVFEFLLHLFSSILSNASLDRSGSAVNDSLGLFQAQTSDLFNSFDNSGLSVADFSQDNVELGFFFSSRSSSAASNDDSTSSSRNAKFFLDGLNQLVQFEDGKSLDFFDHSRDFFRSHENIPPCNYNVGSVSEQTMDS